MLLTKVLSELQLRQKCRKAILGRAKCKLVRVQGGRVDRVAILTGTRRSVAIGQTPKSSLGTERPVCLSSTSSRVSGHCGPAK